MNSSAKRLIHFECARGLASVIVMFHHFSLAFAPGVKDDFGAGGVQGTPLFVLLNGHGAVNFFFMLSGFVLTLGLYKKPGLPTWFISVVKRLPRLMIPAGASILLGLLVLSYAGHLHVEAAALSHAPWLASFGYAYLPAGFRPSLPDAMEQTILVFIWPGNFHYNSNLWTMVNEFYGSLLVLGICLLFMTIPAFRKPRVLVLLHVLLIALSIRLHYDFAPFVVGSCLAYWISRHEVAFSISPAATLLLVTLAVIGFSVEDWTLSTLSSVCVMLILLGSRRTADRLSGRTGALLGAFSFPLYLVHTLVILSVSSFVYIKAMGSIGNEAVVLALTLAVTVAVSLAAAIPFLYLDAAWVGWLNRVTRDMVRRVTGATRDPHTVHFAPPPPVETIHRAGHQAP